jgi:hypothetical protein
MLEEYGKNVRGKIGGITLGEERRHIIFLRHLFGDDVKRTLFHETLHVWEKTLKLPAGSLERKLKSVHK